MPPGRSVSYPLSIDPVAAPTRAALRARLRRVALVGWAIAIYVLYWLGEVGLR